VATTAVTIPPGPFREAAATSTVRPHGSPATKPRAIVVATPQQETLKTVRVRRDGAGRLSCPPARQVATRGRWPAARPALPLCAILLPRNCYLTRLLELPATSKAETQTMVRLEVEAWLPPEYGPAEVSYRCLSRSPQNVLLEVYILRQSDAARCAGCVPRLIIPSAAIWPLLRGCCQMDALLVIPHGGDVYEVVGPDANGACPTRLITAPPAALTDTLAECARSMTPFARPICPALAWLGQPPRGVSDRFHCVDVLAGLRGNTDLPSEGDDPAIATLLAAGAIVLNPQYEGLLGHVNLLPQSFIARAQRRQTVGWLFLSTATLALAILLFTAALRLSAWRHASRLAELHATMAGIRTESESIQEQLQHLQLVAATQATHTVFPRILAALLEASPDAGLSYGQLDVNADGRVRLHGQAQSLALPFLLPQRLEALPQVKDVLLRDAGQVKKGAGSVTEFSLEFTFQPETAP